MSGDLRRSGRARGRPRRPAPRRPARARAASPRRTPAWAGVAGSCGGQASSGVDGSPGARTPPTPRASGRRLGRRRRPRPVNPAMPPRPWTPKTNAISRAWHAPSQPPIAGEPQAKRYTNVAGWCATCASASASTGARKKRSVSIANHRSFGAVLSPRAVAFAAERLDHVVGAVAQDPLDPAMEARVVEVARAGVGRRPEPPLVDVGPEDHRDVGRCARGAGSRAAAPGARRRRSSARTRTGVGCGSRPWPARRGDGRPARRGARRPSRRPLRLRGPRRGGSRWRATPRCPLRSARSRGGRGRVPAGRRSGATTDVAPADSPKIVTLPGSPPNAAMLSRTQRSAATWSRRPWFAPRSGWARNPSAPSR